MGKNNDNDNNNNNNNNNNVDDVDDDDKQQESVWDYPRPPRVEPVTEKLRVVLDGVEIANSKQGFRVLETSHPPTYYIPKRDIRMEYLVECSGKSTYCEFKGSATYYSVQVGKKQAVNCAWSYANPTSRFESIKDYVSFYANKMDECYVADEKVKPQEGDFYGGWITSKIVGPFKGGAGTWGW